MAPRQDQNCLNEEEVEGSCRISPLIKIFFSLGYGNFLEHGFGRIDIVVKIKSQYAVPGKTS